ncbi:hypothetical protein V5799_014816 [Amblyomma americanum]|uniref:Uncharacterized protein n=1 Tax=Amblyomma americanum TaxID=6943 RepID=A0AAQ4E1X9_AMBAM
MDIVEGTTITPEELWAPGHKHQDTTFASEGGRYVPLEKSGLKTAKQRAQERHTVRKLAAKSFERQQTRVPDGAEEIVLRPHGGLLKLTKYGTTHFTDIIKLSSVINPREENEDTLTPNIKQHSILVITTSAERKLRYASLKNLKFGTEKVETSA